MISLKSFIPVALISLSGIAALGCKDDPPPPTPEPSTSAAANSAGKGKLALRNPGATTAKVDPQTMKEYRVDLCYYGSYTLRQARDAYLASLGKDEPSEKKIPSFGSSASMVPPVKMAGSADPKPSASAGPSAGDPMSRKPFDMTMRAPHERNARGCSAAAGLKEPAMPEVDAALATFGPYAVELAKNIAAAQNYYAREEYKKDKEPFAKGKELHKKLVEDFKKLDEQQAKLGEAVAAWRKGHAPDASKLDEGQKVMHASFEDARTLIHGVIERKDAAALKENIAKLEKSVEALKAFGTANAADPWAKITAPAFDGFLKAAKEAEAKTSDKGTEVEPFLALVNTFNALIESKHRALTRSLVAKGQTNEPRSGIADPHGGRMPKPKDEQPASPH